VVDGKSPRENGTTSPSPSHDAARQWVAIVDLDSLGTVDLGATIDIVSAIMPSA